LNKIFFNYFVQNKTIMKKIFTLIFIYLFTQNVNAQLLLFENFDFTGDLVLGSWDVHSGSSDPISTTSGLTFPGYNFSGIGNAANVIGAGFDYSKGFTLQSSGAVFLSVMVNVTESGNNITGSYFLHLGDRVSSTTFTSFCTRLFAKVDGSGNVNFGASHSSTATYATGNFAKNTTYLIVLKTTLSNPAADPDNLKMWVFPTSIPIAEIQAPTPDVEITTQTATSTNTINAVGIRQSTNMPDVVVDGIRVSTTWDEALLPLNLSQFSASLINNSVKINWNTYNEVNVNNFLIERSADGRNFASVGSENARNTVGNNSYSFTDIKPLSGVSYYRLKMMDKDGSYKYSQIVVINNKAALSVEVFPNPVVNSVTISHPKGLSGAVIRILSPMGNTLQSIPVQVGSVQTGMDVSNLQKGNYIVVFDNNGERRTSKIIKQ